MSKSPISEIIQSTGVPALIDTTRKFVETLFGPAIEEGGELLRDHVRSYRWRNQIKILEKAQSFAATAHLEIGAVPLRTLVPLLESAGLEDQPILQDMWAALLASAAGNATSSATRPAFVDILKQFSPPEAWILSKWFVKCGFPRPTSWNVADLSLRGAKDAPYDRAEFATAKTNLLRLGLLSTDQGFAGELRKVRDEIKKVSRSVEEARGGRANSSRSYWPSLGSNYSPQLREEHNLTPLGFQFLFAVMPPVARPIAEPWINIPDSDQLYFWERLTEALAREFVWIPDLAAELEESSKRTREEITRRERTE